MSVAKRALPTTFYLYPTIKETSGRLSPPNGEILLYALLSLWLLKSYSIFYSNVSNNGQENGASLLLNIGNSNKLELHYSFYAVN